jgi:leucine dehydrogenase
VREREGAREQRLVVRQHARLEPRGVAARGDPHDVVRVGAQHAVDGAAARLGRDVQPAQRHRRPRGPVRPAAEPVRVRVQQRQAGRRPGAPGAHPARHRQQLLVAVAQRDAEHAASREERRLQRPGRQHHGRLAAPRPELHARAHRREVTSGARARARSGRPRRRRETAPVEVTSALARDGHEQLVAVADEAVGLRAFVAVHSTVLGPALGGIRFWRYPREDDAVADVLRLSAAMTRKAAVAGLRQGGGKTVVLWDDPHAPRSDAFRHSLGRAIHLLGGRYLAAEDVGATQADMDGIATRTPWVTGVDPARGGSGDPSPVTAWGVLHAMHAACEEAFGDGALGGRRIVVQGVGKVGAELARLLAERGAHVLVCDVDAARAAEAAGRAGAEVVAPGDALATECDVLAPCALGGVLHAGTIGRLRCRVVCGAANNQLADVAADRELAARGIVYAPDFVANAGGILNIAQEWAPGGYARDAALAAAAAIGDTTRRVLALAREEGVPPGAAAEEVARRRLRDEGGAPYVPGDPSVMRDALVARWDRFRAPPP